MLHDEDAEHLAFLAESEPLLQLGRSLQTERMRVVGKGIVELFRRTDIGVEGMEEHGMMKDEG